MFLKPLTLFSTCVFTPDFTKSNIFGLFGLKVVIKVKLLLFSIVLGCFQGKVNLKFSKISHRRKENNTVAGQIFSLLKNCVLCSSINWPSNLVNHVSCKCSLL